VRVVTDIERRARLVRRHALAPESRLTDPVAVAESMVCLHATEPASVHLAVAARSEGVSAADVDAALYDDRSLVKQLAMRRTLFAFPRALLPAVWGSASARVADTERKKIGKDVVVGGVAEDGDAWLAEAREEVLALLATAGDLPARKIREQVPILDVKVSGSPASERWGAPVNVAPRVLSWLGARADVVRGRNGGHWRTSRPQWTLMNRWLGEAPTTWPTEKGYAELVRRWLARFGPGTEADLVWWLGSTKSAVRAALAAIGAVEVGLEGGGAGWVLPDDPIATSPEHEIEPWAALLPTLDPTVMGWKERGFYLDAEDVAYLFDSNGNAGNTAWWDGRIVGCWVQDADATVRVILRHDIGDAGRAALEADAERLTAWLDGVVITNVYASRQMKEGRLP
jgi:hypothetical protein